MGLASKPGQNANVQGPSGRLISSAETLQVANNLQRGFHPSTILLEILLLAVSKVNIFTLLSNKTKSDASSPDRHG